MSNSIKKLTEAYSSIYSDQLDEKAWWDPMGAFESPKEKAERESATKGKVATSGGVFGRIDPKTKEFVAGNVTNADTDRYVQQRGSAQIAKDKADVAAVTRASAVPGTPAPAAPAAPAAPVTGSAPVAPRPTQTATVLPSPTQTSTKPKASPTTPTKSEPTIPVGTTAGGTKFERRAATGAELRAAQAARANALASGKSKPDAEEAAVKAGVARSQPTTGPTPAIPNKADVAASMKSFTPRDMSKNPLKPTGAPSLLSKSGGVGPVGPPATKPELPLGTKVPVKKESRNIIRGYLMREGYTN